MATNNFLIQQNETNYFIRAREGDEVIFQSGTSMTPTAPPGSILLIREVKSWREYFGYGDVFVLLLSDRRRLTKEVQQSKKDPDKYVLCVSHNPDVDDEELPRDMIARVFKVIQILSSRGW